MEGIQILSQEVIYSAGMKPLAPALIAAIVIFMIFFVAAIKEDDPAFVMLGAIIASFVGLIVGTIVEKITEEPTDRYEYKVLIDDSVSANEFYEKYDLISVEGQIFTIRDKEKTE